MGLVDMQRRQVDNFKWILHDVDYHSGFSHVACLKNKKEIAKRRARKSSTQGSVGHGNKTFKHKLFEWMEENKSESWAEVGVYIVNAQKNQCQLGQRKTDLLMKCTMASGH